MKTVVLLSGGMDSTVLLHLEHQKNEVVAALSFDYGAKHAENELEMAKYHVKSLGIRHHVIPLNFISENFSSHLLKTGGDVPDGHYEEAIMKQTVVPFRNGIMLSIAAGFAESVSADAISIAAHAGDHTIYPDCRGDFMQHFSAAIRTGTYAGIELRSPFVHSRKEDIVTIGHELEVDFSRTWSCYKGKSIHCGTCGTCVERKEAFERANICDPTTYLA